MNKIKIIISTTLLLVLTACSSNMSFILEDKEVIYNGEIHSLTYNENLEDTTVVYENNEHKYPGVYEVKAIFTHNNKEYISTAKLTINKQVIKPSFIDLDITENTPYHFELNLDVEADYVYTYYLNDKEINKPNSFGTYTVKASFSNYNTKYIIEDIYHEFTIKLNSYNQYLIDNAFIEDKEVEYDGNSHNITVSNNRDLQIERFHISYTYNDSLNRPTEKGVYNVVVIISKHGVIAKELTATLVIK